jgi:hypothetical protein
MDRWRPETRTFHFPVDELVPTLQDVVLLFGLPCASETMGVVDIVATWCEDFLARFVNIPQNDRAPRRTSHSRTLTDPPWSGCSSSVYVP